MTKPLGLLFAFAIFSAAGETPQEPKRDCMTILNEIEALEKEKKADTINRVGHAVLGGLFYESDKESQQQLKLLKLEMQSCDGE